MNIKRMSAGDKDHNDTCHDYESGYRWLHECGSERRDINIKRMPAVDKDHNDTCHDYESGYRWLHECGSERRDINIKQMLAVTHKADARCSIFGKRTICEHWHQLCVTDAHLKHKCHKLLISIHM